MTISLPSETRSAVSSDLANPRNPPTPVRPLADAARAGSAPAPSVRSDGEVTGDELGEEEVNTRAADTRGAGSTPIKTTATTATSAPAPSSGSHGTPDVSDTDCHMATRPHTQQATQARTHAPRARSTDCAAATAMRAVDPASEYVTSRRDGTSNAWVDRTHANRTASGPSTVAMSPGVAVRVTVRMNHTNPPTAQRASTGLTPGHGWARRR